MDEYERATSPTDSLIENEQLSPKHDDEFFQERQLNGAEITFYDICYAVDVKAGCCHKASKEVLHNVRYCAYFSLPFICL